MNRGKAISKITVILVIMLLYVDISQAAGQSFKTCYEGCALGCFLVKKDEAKCLLKCIGTCLVGSGSGSGPSPPLGPVSESARLDSCKFGCAINQCAKFGKDIDKVADCVDACEIGKCSFLANAPAI